MPIRISYAISSSNSQNKTGYFDQEEAPTTAGKQVHQPPQLNLKSSRTPDGVGQGFGAGGSPLPGVASPPPPTNPQNTTIDFLPPPTRMPLNHNKGGSLKQGFGNQYQQPPNFNPQASKGGNWSAPNRSSPAYAKGSNPTPKVRSKIRHQIEKEKLETIAYNIRRIHRHYPYVSENSAAHKMMKSILHKQALTWINSIPMCEPDFHLQKWNKQFQRFSNLQLPENLAAPLVLKKSRKKLKGQKGDSPDKALTAWYEKPMKSKKMTAQKKFSELLIEILPVKHWTEDMEVALKAFFGHTANFNSKSGIGRDFLNKDHGKYFRSSLERLRQKSSEVYKKILVDQKLHKHLKDQSYQSYNRALVNLLAEAAKLDQRIKNSKFLAPEGDSRFGVSILKVNRGMGTGSLGLLSNVYHTLRLASKLLNSTIPIPEEIEKKEAISPVEDLISDGKLDIGGSGIYRDEMLKDRGNLVRQVSREIENGYGPTPHDKTKIIPIQNDGHPSLILGLEHPNTNLAFDKPTEKEFREAFIKHFNRSANQRKSEIRLTHRGSFGFPFPTASSVGTPVRVWPGLAPYKVFKQLLFGALVETTEQGIHFNEERTKKVEEKGKKHEVKYQYIKNVDFARIDLSGASCEDNESTIYISGLKTAVRYVQAIIGKKMVLNAPREAFDWTIIRLKKNLLKANWILEKAQTGEKDYVKAISTMENLMEYGFLLESLLHSPEAVEQQDDPYAAYFQRTMGLDKADNERKDLENITFYLDSGMQAIVCANLLARVYHNPEDSEELLETIDLYSYFEYGMVDFNRLGLDAVNRRKAGDQADEGSAYIGNNFLDVMSERFLNTNRSPAIIAADLNPVFVDKPTKEGKILYQDVFETFAGTSPYLNDFTIPILDVTNASLSKAAEMDLHKGYQNFIVVESLSKHQQMGADKFTMGRLTAVGNHDFIELAKEIVAPVAEAAHDRLTMMMALRMDRIFYGEQKPSQQDQYMEEAQATPEAIPDQEMQGPKEDDKRGTKRNLDEKQQNPHLGKRSRKDNPQLQQTISPDEQMLCDQVNQILQAPSPAPKTQETEKENPDRLPRMEAMAYLRNQIQGLDTPYTLDDMENWL